MPQGQNRCDRVAFGPPDLGEGLVQDLRIDLLVQALSAISVGGVDDGLPLVYPARALERASRLTSASARFKSHAVASLLTAAAHGYSLTHNEWAVASTRTSPIALGVTDSPSIGEDNRARCCPAIRQRPAGA